MNWYLTRVYIKNDQWTIEGVNKFNEVLDCKIIKSTLEKELARNDTYNERKGLCVISPAEVYRIEVAMDRDPVKCDSKYELQKISADECKYFDDEYYMGLPVTVFCYWKGMINTVI